ncbi:MAG: phytase [Bacteroidota bacterium]
MILRTLFFLVITGLWGCQAPAEEPVALAIDATATEAREDSLALAAAYLGQARIEHQVSAKVETASTQAEIAADAADDPAIWVHPTSPEKSLVFGSNKTGGLAAYNLAGEEVAYYPIGKINNVDVLTDVPLDGELITLLGCSNRTDQSIDLFRIDQETGALTNVAAGPLLMDRTRIDDVYGFCLGRSGEVVYAIANGKNGTLQQFRLVEDSASFALKLVREVTFPSQTEGMVADNDLGWLYVGEEARGIWKLPLRPQQEGALPQVISEVNEQGPAKLLSAKVGSPAALVADVEGLSLYEGLDSTGYLVASIQGNFSYAVFERTAENRYLGSFKILDAALDGVEETDGLEVVSTPLPDFPGGLLVVQDGFNFAGGRSQPQNFKYVDFGEVLRVMK